MRAQDADFDELGDLSDLDEDIRKSLFVKTADDESADDGIMPPSPVATTSDDELAGDRQENAATMDARLKVFFFLVCAVQ